MADNVPITAGVGTPVATDEIGGAHYQRVKISDGTPDSANHAIVSLSGALKVGTVDSSVTATLGAEGESVEITLTDATNTVVIGYTGSPDADMEVTTEGSVDGSNWAPVFVALADRATPYNNTELYAIIYCADAQSATRISTINAAGLTKCRVRCNTWAAGSTAFTLKATAAQIDRTGLIVTPLGGTASGITTSLASATSTPGIGDVALVVRNIPSGTQAVSGPLTDAELRLSPLLISAASLPLPSNAATDGRQDVGNASLSSIDSKITVVNTGAVVVSSSALPSGAATAAKQPAIGTAGTSSADVITVQGRAAMTPLLVDGSGAIQPVSGPLTDAQLRATAVPVSGTLALSGAVDTELTTADLDTGAGTDTRAVVGLVYGGAGGGVLVSTSNPLPISDNGGAITVDGTFWQATQPVSIAATVAVSGALTDAELRATAVPVSAAALPLPTGASTAANQATIIGHVDGLEGLLTTIDADTGTLAGAVAGTEVQVDVVAALPTGANTIGAVNLAQYTPATGRLPVDGSGVTQPVSGTFFQATQPVSAATLPLPSGAATAAKQPALGTAGSAASDVITVQGIASMTALKVDGSAVTQPVSGTFWQATQPVSGTFYQATQPVSIAATVAVKEIRAATGTLSNVAGSASSVTLLASNANRLGAAVYNDSTAILYLKLGATASSTSFTVKMNADDYYEIPANYTGIIDGIWASAAGSARVTEIT